MPQIFPLPLFVPPALARALFYLQNFERSIDFKAFADLLGSLIVDLVVADVQVNQNTVNFESFC